MRSTSKELAILVSVVEGGSFNRAAGQLGQTSSTVSRVVKKLEVKLGVSLLNRVMRQLSLAEEGERYFHCVQSILQEMTAAESEIMEMHNTPYGLLRISAATPVVLHSLMPLTKPFRKRCPKTVLPLVSSEVIIDLIERKVSAAIRAGTLADSGLRTKPLSNSYRKIIASPSYISCYGKPEMTDDLKQYICLKFTEPASLNTWPIARSNGQLHEVKYGLSSNSGETLKQPCLSGNGIACLSDYMTDKEIARRELVELMTDKVLPAEMPFSAVYYSDHMVSMRIQTFIDFLSEHVKTAPGGIVREA